MRVLVTGHRGYIGAHLVGLLKAAGHEVTGCDLGLFDSCAWEDLPAPDAELAKDVRSLAAADLDGIDCVMHLAAISNDPMGDLDPQITYSVNRDAAAALARLAKARGVRRFIFASSCSIYGRGERLDLSEADPVHPLTAYARSKIEAEELIGGLADGDFCPVLMRNATAYGHSPMLRIDLVVNSLLASALACGEIRIMSDGEPWRPLIHCRDIARAMVAFMDADPGLVGGRVVNVGGNGENYQVKDVAAKVRELVPDAELVFTGEIGHDPRDFRVHFDLLGELLPGFELEYTLAAGMEELLGKFREHGFAAADYEGDRFVRLRTLRRRLNLLEGRG